MMHWFIENILIVFKFSSKFSTIEIFKTNENNLKKQLFFHFFFDFFDVT